MAKTSALLAAVLLSIFGFHRRKPIEPQLAGVEVGGRTAAIEQAHRGLLKHHLDNSTLWEACNQKDLQVFTFAESPVRCGYVANIEISAAESAGACRDPSGTLPDLQLTPATPRGIGLGASEADIRKAYGKPEQAEQTRGERYLRYRSKLKKHPSGATSLVLVFTLRNGKVASISLGLGGPQFEKAPPANLKPCTD